jgi:hypothetical protein
MKVLKLTVKKQEFDMIKSGEKKEEYREINPYWFNRLVFQSKEVFKYITGYDWDDGLYLVEGVDRICYNQSDMITFNQFEDVQFFNGAYFSEKLPNLKVKCEGIHIGRGKCEWGAVLGRDYFVIKLGKPKLNNL